MSDFIGALRRLRGERLYGGPRRKRLKEGPVNHRRRCCGSTEGDRDEKEIWARG